MKQAGNKKGAAVIAIGAPSLFIALGIATEHFALRLFRARCPQLDCPWGGLALKNQRSESSFKSPHSL
jgi:hypothetical protein